MDSDLSPGTTWVCTDLFGSYDEVEPDRVEEFRAGRDEYLRRVTSLLDGVAEAARRDSDGVEAILHDARKAVDAAREVDQIAARTKFPFHFRSRIGVHTEPGSHSLDGNYTEGAAKATRIMQMCPRDYILCSEDTLDEVPGSALATFQTYGPVFCKLRGPVRPVPLYAIPGEAASGPPHELAPWQTGQRLWPTFVDPLGVIRTRGPGPYLAALASEIMWATLRDRALYSLGNWDFASYTGPPGLWAWISRSRPQEV